MENGHSSYYICDNFDICDTIKVRCGDDIGDAYIMT